MTNLTRSTSRPPAARSRLLLVRPPVRSVRGGDHIDHTPTRLAIGVVTGTGIVALVWLAGHLGYRLGFAPAVRVPELMDGPRDGFATGATMLISIPRTIFHAGMAQPGWLMLGFLMIALPAASLAAARPLTPGGPRPKPAIALLSALGAVGAMASGILILWWTGSPVRTAFLGVLPADPAAAARWHTNVQTAAGLDVMATVAAALWVVLVMRLGIPRWMRSIAAAATMFTLVVSIVAMSMSNATATECGTARSLCTFGDETPPRLIIGATPQHLATLVADASGVRVELRAMDERISVNGQRSIVGYLAEIAAAGAE